jgi:hypothetical protein
MNRPASWLAIGALILAAANPAPSAARDRDDKSDKKDDTAAIIGGLAAIGIGIAIATSKHGDDHRHDSQWDGNLYGNPFTPAPGVVCMPGQRQCYERGHHSYSWTKRVFGTSVAFSNEDGGWDGGYGDFGSFGVDLERARAVCLEQSAGIRLRNVSIDEAKQMTDEWAYVYLRARPKANLPDFERWRCAYSFRSGKTDFKRM